MTGRPYPVPDVAGISRAITYGALVDPAVVEGPFFASRTVIYFKQSTRGKQSNDTTLTHRPRGAQPRKLLPRQRSILLSRHVEYWFEAKRAFARQLRPASSAKSWPALIAFTSGDDDGWYNEWNATAERFPLKLCATGCRSSRKRTRRLLRAANYFRTSEFFLHGNHEDPRIYSAYKKSIRHINSAPASLTRHSSGGDSL